MESNRAEYVLSNTYRSDTHAKLSRYFLNQGIDPTVGSVLMDVKKVYLDQIFAAIAERYESLDQYLELTLEISRED